MSAFDTTYADCALPQLMDQLGRAITYDPADGDKVELTAIVGQITTEEQAGERGGKKVQIRTVIITTDADGIYGGVAAPRQNEELIIDGDRWAVEAQPTVSASAARLRVVRIGSRERSRDGYRGAGRS